MIQLDGLTVRAGDFLLGEVSFAVPRGGYGLIIGPTGSGKTTLLEAVAGHVPLKSGRVLLNGMDVTGLPPERRELGFVYQQYHLFPHLTVRENICYGLRGPTRGDRAGELAELLGVTPLLNRTVRGLSGGEQQRVALGRALAPRPRILLLDEPFAAVDPATRHLLRRELRALHEREGITTLQVTHDFDEAMRLGDIVAVLSEGRIAQHGPPEEVFRYPNSAFVARFVGTGNVLAGTVERCDASGGSPFAARFTSGALTLEVVAEREGLAHAVIRPEDITLSRDEAPSSARNRMAATIAHLELLGPIIHVHLDVGRPLIAAVTAASAGAMGLHRGARVMVAVKATAVRLV
ncbi:MAG TPA: ABC transporter ATP-binding protein [Gemmatimonadales bacterium]|nr:ABC transporter ATP-binding protein [Gemmatimonadales bacterium]